MVVLLGAILTTSAVLCPQGTQSETRATKDELEAEGRKWLHGAQTKGVKVPAELLIAYARFVRAAKDPKREILAGLCLPQTVPITTEERPPKKREYGRDINIPFLRHVFPPGNIARGIEAAQIHGVQKYTEDSYLIQTGYSVLYFSKTKSGDWKLYRYFDEPVE
jgi:hypothetical protein